ncbi:MAG: carbon monoxide dehydrogenase subunit G [Chloroflexota bacterium]
MKLNGEYTFDGPREEVWKMFRDPDLLILALPGTKSLKQISENEYEGELQVRIGPITGSFGGKLTVSNERPLESVTLTVEGAGKIGFVKGAGDVILINQSEARTLVRYSGEIQIGGRVASVGQRLFDTVSKSMIEQGLNKLNGILKERPAT